MQTFFFIAFPYIALILAVGVGLYRYFSHRFTYSSLSSQLLENRHLFWGSVSWHYGITLILVAHVLPWLFPRAAAAVLGDPTRLMVLELTGLALGFYCVFGIVVLIARRLPNDSRARAVTSPMDWILLLVLAFQVLSGVGIALFDRWGSAWYLSTAVPVAVVPRPTGPGREYRRGAPTLHTVPPDQWLRTDPAVSFHPAGTCIRDPNRIPVAALPGSHLEPESATARIASAGQGYHWRADSSEPERSGSPPVALQVRHIRGFR
jgi:nitrate reductase gamma subunit